jgi:hypothetical protein
LAGAAVLSMIVGPARPALSFRAPAAASAPCHAYQGTSSPAEEYGRTTGLPPDGNVNQADPEAVPGQVGETRETRMRDTEGNATHTFSAFADGYIVGGSPLNVQVRKRLRLQDFACPSLPHGMKSQVSANLHTRIKIPAPLLPGDIARCATHSTARGDRQNDLGLGDRSFKTVTVSYVRTRTPDGTLRDGSKTVILAAGNPAVVRPSKTVSGQGIVFESEDLEGLESAEHAFNSWAGVSYDGQAFVLYLKAPAKVPAGDPDDDVSVRAEARTQVRDVNVSLRDTSEGLGE